MEKMHMTLNAKITQELKDNYEKALTDKDFQKLVTSLKISNELGQKNTSKLEDTVAELKNCRKCQGLFMCANKVTGHVYYPEKEEERLNFSYVACKYQKEMEQAKSNKQKDLNDIANARMKDIDITDKKRVPIIKWLKNFYDQYEPINNLKGLYLHGSFGSGKTYLIAALLNELALKKHAQVEIVYFPELLRNLKEDFTTLEDKLYYYETVDILFIDDIGAENVTSWGRDEILGTILQSRMNNKLTTFFTSNFTIAELEKHLALTKGSEDVVKARRIIERIKQLTEDLELVSVNRRS